MPNFNSLKSLETSSKTTVEYEIIEITLSGKIPVLTVRPATSNNKLYMNSILHRAVKMARRIKKGHHSVEMLDELRESDRLLYSKYIIIGWRNVVDDDGTAITFSQPNCQEFMSALPGWIFDELRVFCGETSNFVNHQDPEDINYLVKNS